MATGLVLVVKRYDTKIAVQSVFVSSKLAWLLLLMLLDLLVVQDVLMLENSTVFASQELVWLMLLMLILLGSLFCWDDSIVERQVGYFLLMMALSMLALDSLDMGGHDEL